MTRQGIDLDPQGRCAHYHSVRDIALNRCATCGDYFACHRCHEDLTDHVFGVVDKRDPEAVECGECGHRMGYAEYSTAPGCGHEFNPGCAAHAHLYWG